VNPEYNGACIQVDSDDSNDGLPANVPIVCSDLPENSVDMEVSYISSINLIFIDDIY